MGEIRRIIGDGNDFQLNGNAFPDKHKQKQELTMAYVQYARINFGLERLRKEIMNTETELSQLRNHDRENIQACSLKLTDLKKQEAELIEFGDWLNFRDYAVLQMVEGLATSGGNPDEVADYCVSVANALVERLSDTKIKISTGDEQANQL